DQAASVISLRRLPSLHPQVSWILQESRKASCFPLHPLLGMVRRFHFLLRPGSAILHLVVLLARVKVVDLVACRRPAKEKESRQVAPVFFAVRSSPELGRFLPVAVLFFYFSVLRSSASRNRNCPSLPCFAGRA